MSATAFERAANPDAYANFIAHAYYAGYRLYDPSLSAERDPDAERKMMRWPPFAADLQLRHYGIAGRKWSIVPADEGGDDEKDLARVVGKILGNLDGFTQARINLARADVSGARYAEVVKRTIEARYGDGKPRLWTVPVALRDMPKENFRWMPKREGDRASAVLEYAHKQQGALRWVPVPAGAPLIRHTIGDSEETLGYGRGLRDALFHLFTAQTRVFEADVQAAERFGHGWLVLRLASKASGKPTVTNDEIVTASNTALNKMRAKHNFVIDKDDTLEMLAPPANAAQFMAALFERLVKMSSRLISAGQMLGPDTADGLGSKRAETEADTANSVFDTLADVLEESLTRDLVAPMVRDNWPNFVDLGLAEADHPMFGIVRGRKQDPRSAAERLDIVLRRAPVKKSQYYDLVGLEPPGPDDEVIEAQAPFDPLAGPGGSDEGGAGGAGPSADGEPSGDRFTGDGSEFEFVEAGADEGAGAE